MDDEVNKNAKLTSEINIIDSSVAMTKGTTKTTSPLSDQLNQKV